MPPHAEVEAEPAATARIREMLELVLCRARPVPEHGRPDRITCYSIILDRGEIDRIIGALEGYLVTLDPGEIDRIIRALEGETC